jgi:hypothetical protein
MNLSHLVVIVENDLIGKGTVLATILLDDWERRWLNSPCLMEKTIDN